MGWFGNSEEEKSYLGKELVAMTVVTINPNFTYYLRSNGDVWRKNKTKDEWVVHAGVTKEKKYHYYITTGGNVSRIPKHLVNSETFDEAEKDSLIETNADNYTNADIYIGIKDSLIEKAQNYEENGSYSKAISIYSKLGKDKQVKRINSLVENKRKKLLREKNKKIAEDKEQHLDYDSAIALYDKIGDKKSAKRVRKLKAEEGAVKVDQTVVQGDQITNTEIKDSVLNRSNVGSGGPSKMQELKDLTEMKEKGFIDDDEFKQMKKEILGK
jgi:hypothetical protein